MVGGLIGGIGGLFLLPALATALTEPHDGVNLAELAGLIVGPLGFGSLGYHLGKEADREMIILTIGD